jgi:DNA polymerase-4
MPRTILHVDMDAFFASVEQHDHPEWRGKPLVVGAAPDQRGVVAAASYEAREFGIHSAMPSRQAYERCPQAIFVPPNSDRYRDASRQIMGIFERFTPIIEPLSIDEAFLDVTGSQKHFGDGHAIATRIKSEVRNDTGLTASVGVASNKFLAKLASDLEKPDGLTVVPEGREAAARFLAPLPVNRIWGVGRVTQRELDKFGIHTIADLQNTSEKQLAPIVGEHSARHLHRLAWGEDARELELDREEKSMSREHTFPQDITNVYQLEQTLRKLIEEIGRRLRKAEKHARIVHLKLRWKGFQTITRRKALPRPCCDDFVFTETALELLRNEDLTRPVRLVGFGVSDFSEQATEQLDLFADPADRTRRETISRAMDTIRDQFGEDAIGRGSKA